MRRITLLNAVSNYDWVRSFTDDMRLALLEHGCECQMIDSARNPGAADCQRLIEQFKSDLLLGFNAAGFGIRHPSGALLPSERYPYLSFMVDNPMFHGHWIPFLRHTGVYTGISDPTHRRSALRLGIPEERIVDVRLGGHVSPLARDSERTTPILILCSIGDPEVLRASLERQLPPTVYKLFEFVAETWSARLDLGVHDAFDRVLSELGIELAPAERLNLEFIVTANVDRYVRNKERLRIVRALSDLPALVVGDGWSELIDEPHRFQFSPQLSFHQAHEAICRAQILINVQPIAVHTAYERSLGALLNGALLATTENRFLSRHFVEEEEFLPFASDAASLAALRDRISDLLASPARRQAITERARATALNGHTWRHRAAELLELTRALAPAA